MRALDTDENGRGLFHHRPAHPALGRAAREKGRTLWAERILAAPPDGRGQAPGA